MELWTAHVSHYRKLAANDITMLDITVKSGDKRYAPTYDMVMTHKASACTPEDDAIYTRQYVAMMNNSYKQDKQAWHDLFKQDRLALCCYCPEGRFCHRNLMVTMLTQIADKFGYKLEYKGFITKL